MKHKSHKPKKQKDEYGCERTIKEMNTQERKINQKEQTQHRQPR